MKRAFEAHKDFGHLEGSPFEYFLTCFFLLGL